VISIAMQMYLFLKMIHRRQNIITGQFYKNVLIAWMNETMYLVTIRILKKLISKLKTICIRKKCYYFKFSCKLINISRDRNWKKNITALSESEVRNVL